MLILLTGGVRSGKSTLAARMLETFPGEKHYIATMRILDEECAERVRLHRRFREGKGYVTLECQTGLSDLLLPEGCRVILDCLPNLLANEMFDDPAWEQHPASAALRAAERILCGLIQMKKTAELLIVVTNEVGCDGTLHQSATTAYQKALAFLNREAVTLSDAAAELVAGIPQILKDDAQNFLGLTL